jgi:hypothetical protein
MQPTLVVCGGDWTSLNRLKLASTAAADAVVAVVVATKASMKSRELSFEKNITRGVGTHGVGEVEDMLWPSNAISLCKYL